MITGAIFGYVDSFKPAFLRDQMIIDILISYARIKSFSHSKTAPIEADFFNHDVYLNKKATLASGFFEWSVWADQRRALIKQ
jgi:hypothetical protein